MFNGLLQSENNCLSRSDCFCKSFDVCQTVCLACVSAQWFCYRSLRLSKRLGRYVTILFWSHDTNRLLFRGCEPLRNAFCLKRIFRLLQMKRQQLHHFHTCRACPRYKCDGLCRLSANMSRCNLL